MLPVRYFPPKTRDDVWPSLAIGTAIAVAPTQPCPKRHRSAQLVQAAPGAPAWMLPISSVLHPESWQSRSRTFRCAPT